MSDIEKLIEQWRKGLAASELPGASDVEELETHLRDEMEHLKALALSDDEAFLIARYRLGDTAALEEEFVKVNPLRWRTNRLWWMILGVLTCLVALHFGRAASQVSLAVTQGMDLSPHVLAFLAGVVRIGTFCAVGVFIIWLCLRCSRPGSASQPPMARRVRMIFLLGLLLETLGFALTNRFLIRPVPGFKTMIPPDYSHIVTPASNLWWLVGPALLGVLLLALYLAGLLTLTSSSANGGPSGS